MASASNRIGETNDIPAPKPGRGVMSLTHARLEYPRESCFLIFLAFAMSTDAFAAAIGKGSSLDRPRSVGGAAHRIIFGVIEAITPLVGWLLGQAASQFVADWDHWIAFVLLVLLGLAHDPQRPARGS